MGCPSQRIIKVWIELGIAPAPMGHLAHVQTSPLSFPSVLIMICTPQEASQHAMRNLICWVILAFDFLRGVIECSVIHKDQSSFLCHPSLKTLNVSISLRKTTSTILKKLTYVNFVLFTPPPIPKKTKNKSKNKNKETFLLTAFIIMGLKSPWIKFFYNV